MKKPIETVLFDFGGTLDANGVAWKERFSALYRAEGLDMAADVFESGFFAADDLLVGNLAPETDLSETVHALVANLDAELARRGAISRHAGDRCLRVAARFLTESSAAFARNRPALAALSEHHQLGIVSNFYGNLQGVCRGAGLESLFAVLVDSYRVGLEKPDPKIFRAALEPLGATPETTVFVGDSLRRDGEGARGAGMRFIWMAPHAVPTAEAPAPTDPPIEHTVAQLSDLVTILT
jgi:FMN hydrolase / 5-amino-6-(5-phospho-D-ribitylamino)uracil phosphatase